MIPSLVDFFVQWMPQWLAGALALGLCVIAALAYVFTCAAPLWIVVRENDEWRRNYDREGRELNEYYALPREVRAKETFKAWRLRTKGRGFTGN